MTDVPLPPVRYALTGAVATVTLDRPAARNALDTETKVALRDTLAAAAADPAVRAVVLAAEGPAFCVGQDLKEHAQRLRDLPVDEVWATVPEHYAPIALTLATMPKPVVAAVGGVAAGAGASIALACDLRVVGEGAGFNLAFAGIGLSADTGATWTLPRLVGWARAMDLLLLPRTVSAGEALALGLATRVVPDGEVLAAATDLAVALAAGPTAAYAAIKEALHASATAPFAAALDFEGRMMARTGATEDHRRAVASFVAKEKPTFSGR